MPGKQFGHMSGEDGRVAVTALRMSRAFLMPYRIGSLPDNELVETLSFGELEQLSDGFDAMDTAPVDLSLVRKISGDMARGQNVSASIDEALPDASPYVLRWCRRLLELSCFWGLALAASPISPMLSFVGADCGKYGSVLVAADEAGVTSMVRAFAAGVAPEDILSDLSGYARNFQDK